MRLVLTNDDGIESPGIHALAAMCQRLGHDVAVLAPAGDVSGSSAAIGRIGFDDRLHLREQTLPPPAGGIPAFALEGPPGLAALIACQGGLGEPPDLVLSGINAGPNTGHSILHSGTVGAALTAASFGVSALAVSLDVADPMPWASVEPALAQALDVLASAPASTTLNLNVPPTVPTELRWATLDRFGSFRVAVAERAESWVQMEYRSTGAELDPESDTALLAAGYATLTAIEGIGLVTPDRIGRQAEPQRPVARLTEVPRGEAVGAGARSDRRGRS
jgi:5'-nucleotidase